ncbi:hypothetical protein JHK85_025524 [Glycine max]|nr:hypothetical protein JHK85_025524 [Glycine max]
MKTKARSRITNNIVSETEQEASYQDDELIELQVLEVDADVINESLADVDGDGEKIDADLLKQLDLEKYQHRRDEILQRSTEKGTSTQDSPNTATSVNDNEIYLNVVGGPNYKGNVYRLGTLSKRFSCSKSAPSTSIAPVEDQIEEMRETINKLNVELLAKTNKEKTLEEMML